MMFKKIVTAGLMTALLLTTASCTVGQNPKVEIKDTFKSAYENLNNQPDSKSGGTYRKVSIAKNNPVKISKASKIINMIDNKESFVVFFGYPECPWCRSMVSEMVKSAKENKINKIYYVNIEKMRDSLEYDSVTNTFAEASSGTKEYKKLLKKLNSVLEEYKIEYTDEDGNTKEKDTGEKRIYGPSLIYVENGKANSMIDGLSDKQKDANEEVTSEMKDEMKSELDAFFKSVQPSVNACAVDSKC